MNAIAWIAMIFTPPLLFSMLVLGYVARRGAPVLATVGAAMSFVAYANWGAAGNVDYLTYIMGREGYSVAEITSLVDATYDHPVAMISSIGWVIGHILGMILLGIALARSGVVARWVGVVLAVSQPVHLVAAVIVPSRPLDVLGGWGLTTLGFVMVSVAIWRMSDDEFDARPLAGR
ncbi:MAG: hypothetical protein GEU96_07540 [Propionibacteriales bacterium]|nr:hypothetical protein [Propionibacteriales bacterium]